MIEAIKKNRIGPRLVLKSIVVAAVLLPSMVSASGGGAIIQPAGNDVSDIVSLQRGARNFVNIFLQKKTKSG